MPALRVGFAGTPPFAAEALAAIAAAGFAVPVVLTQPDRPSGRGMKLTPSAVKQKALELGIPVLQPPSLKSDEGRAAALAIPLDVLVVAAYGLILPQAVLDWPRHGGINIHASRLPRWRGAAPIQRALLAGDAATGVTLMQMDAGLDTGPMIETIEVPIAPRETSGTLTSKLAAAGAAGIVGVLERLARDGRLPATPQPDDGITYAAKIDRAEAVLDWRQPAAALDRVVRAFDPAPGASTHLGGEAIKIWDAVPLVTGGGAPGTVLAVGAEGIDVACATGSLRLRTVQPAGGKRMPASDFARGRLVAPGATFGV